MSAAAAGGNGGENGSGSGVGSQHDKNQKERVPSEGRKEGRKEGGAGPSTYPESSRCDPPPSPYVLRENGTFFEFSLCLSRACLGKIMHFIYKWRKKCRFLTCACNPEGAVLLASILYNHQRGAGSRHRRETYCKHKDYDTYDVRSITRAEQPNGELPHSLRSKVTLRDGW